MKTTYLNLMKTLKDVWNYKYHNTSDNVVEPYPEQLTPSQVAKQLKLPAYENIDEVLKHADHIHSNNHLKNYLPYAVRIDYNNSRPFNTNLYAQNDNAAKALAIKKFASEMHKYNSPLSRINMINMSIDNGTILIKIKQI